MHPTIRVLGLGHIGLPTASLFATKGCQVASVDVSPKGVETINRTGVHIEEPDLDVLVRPAVNSGNLVARAAPTVADTVIIAVPTQVQPDTFPGLRTVPRWRSPSS